MVKIITNGIIKEKRKPWPYGPDDQLRCPHCGCVFAVEEGDGYRVSGPTFVEVAGVCPFCAEDVRIKPEAKPRPTYGSGGARSRSEGMEDFYRAAEEQHVIKGRIQ